MYQLLWDRDSETFVDMNEYFAKIELGCNVLHRQYSSVDILNMYEIIGQYSQR